jgi:hypothetical protein
LTESDDGEEIPLLPQQIEEKEKNTVVANLSHFLILEPMRESLQVLMVKTGLLGQWQRQTR